MSFLNNLTGDINKANDRESSRKIIMINIFSFLGLVSLVFFGTMRLLQGEVQAAVVDYGISSISLIILLFLRFTKRVNIAAHATVILVFILLLAIFAVIGKGGTGLYWMYLYPLFSIFLLGNKGGNIYSILLIISIAMGLYLEPDFMIQYPEGLLFRIVFTYSFVLALTNVYEYVRYKTHKAFVRMYEEKSNYLEETLQQKEEISSINERLNEDTKIILQQKAEIEEAHENIQSSINYAKRIQDAMLTNKDLLDNYLGNKYFILFKPKEKVSGDFFYVNKVKDHLIFSVADCTGHGVSGGFLTVLGITYLHEIVRREGIKATGEVLDVLRTRIKTIFKTFGTNTRNGLDLNFCAVDTSTNILQYSGAYNPLWIMRNNELLQYDATRNPIGFYPKEQNFTTNSIQLQDKDKIYLFSDGFKDQTGGEKNKKYSNSKFRELIIQTSNLSITEQNKVLEDELVKWQGKNTQVDDITIMGIEWKM